MKILFITRKFPPATGGMENYLYDLITNYQGAKTVLSYGASQKWLPFILVKFFFEASFHLIKDRQIDVIYVGDGVLAPLGCLLKSLFGRKTVMTVYGKDLVFKKFFYQKIIVPWIRKIDSIIAISQCTYQDAIAVGVNPEKITIIPCGIDPEKYVQPKDLELAKRNFAAKYQLKLEGRKILITVGRLSFRKGQLWFVENVMPFLDDRHIYIIVGPDGSDINDFRSFIGLRKINFAEQLQALIVQHSLQERVFWLGKVTADDLNSLLSFADLSIMPNVSCPHDREGFGLVNIEAGLAGLPVIASDLDGIPDSIIVGVTGSLVTPENMPAFVEAIDQWLAKDLPGCKATIAKKVKENYGWNQIIKRNETVFKESLLGDG